MNTICKLHFMEELWNVRAKRLFKAKRITHEKIGKELDLSKPSINQKLNGGRATTIDEIMVMASMLGVTLDDLCSDDPRYTSDKTEVEFLAKFRRMTSEEQSIFLRMLDTLSE